MAFPSSAGTSPFTLDDAFKRVRDVAGRIKTLTAQLKAQSLAGPIPATAVVRYSEGLAALKAQLVSLVSTTGLSAYAQQQYPALDLAASYNTMAAQIDATVLWVGTNFPKAGTGELLEGKLNAAGEFVPNAFSTAALAGLRLQLDALTATID